ncbi:MAG: hypothetical protein WA118_14655 [Carboxydocellales bacterium]
MPTPEPPKYIKHVIVITVDDLENKYFKPAITPRLVGLSREGIQAEVLNSVLLSTGGAKDHALIGKLPVLYKATQKKSLFVDGRGSSQELTQSFNFVINANGEERKNPQQIIGAAINKFKEELPFLTYIILSNPPSEDRDKQKFFQQTDEAFGQFIGTLHERGLYEYTLFVIVGRKSTQTTKLITSDGIEVPLSFPLAIKGPNLIAGQVIPAVTQEDLPITIYYLTDGKEITDNGHILWNILKTDNVYAAQSLLRRRIQDVSTERDQLVRQQWNWELAKLKFEQQSNELQKDRQGIKSQLNSRDQSIKALRWRIIIYHGLAVLVTLLFIAVLTAQYFILRKKFLLF